jgi:sortase A
MSLDPFFDWLRSHLSALFIVFGLMLLGYVSIEYGDMYWSQRELQEKWAEQQSNHSKAAPDTAETPDVDDGLTRLTIPKIDLAAVVVEGTGRKQLLLGPGHMESTPAPGEIGNSVISAHRDTFFRHIYELQKGDEVVVQRNGKTFKYAVLGKRVVQPTDFSVVDQTKDARLTLITCYPTYYIGPAPERLVVVSKLVNDDAAKEADATGANIRKTTLRPPANAVAR